ncbi:hypothetical protein [Membranihabitans marinus]|uniref:hypothetical protein n=1 Tax=Membranihabitans marinus TaxID=1227546 RepID=UPI001F15BE6F|nr:hypothetical protein [Membranihabitans marinus]
MKSIFYSAYYILFAALLFSATYSCQKIEFESPDNLDISYSTDTLTFDTVFTQVGSTTKYLKLYNNGNKYARIDEIKLENEFSPFRFNVDGLTGNTVYDVEIPPNDSIYIFVEVTVDPDLPISESPFIILENLIINTGVKTDRVVLTAWGQNANYVPALTSKRKQSLVTCDMGDWVWDDPKPYVIYGVLIVDSCNLVIPAGTEVYIHGGLVKDGQTSYQDGVLYIAKNGSLEINGSREKPVTISTDRLEEDYQTYVAQWGRIQLGPESKNNRISYTRILHGGIGILVDSLAQLNIDHSIIGFNGEASLASYRGIVFADNCLFHSAAGYNLSLTLGGFYRFRHCTFANAGFGREAVYMRNFHCFDSECNHAVAAALNIEMENCILYSNQTDALVMQNGLEDPSFFKVKFSNSLIRAKDLISEDEYPNFFVDQPSNMNYENHEALFYDINNYNFSLDSLSVAKDKGMTIPEISDDLIGNQRDALPDLGAYELID